MGGRDVAGVLRRHAGRLMAVPGVVGVAEGARAGRPCILVLVERRTADVVAHIPDALEGFPTSVLETGAPQAFERP